MVEVATEAIDDPKVQGFLPGGGSMAKANAFDMGVSTVDRQSKRAAQEAEAYDRDSF